MTVQVVDWLLPPWLLWSGLIVGVYLPSFVITSYVYNWRFVTESDPMFTSLLVVLGVYVWVSLAALRATPSVIERLIRRGALVDGQPSGGVGLVTRLLAVAKRRRHHGTINALIVGGGGMYALMWWEAKGRSGSLNPLWLPAMAREFSWPTSIAILGWVPVAATVCALVWQTRAMLRVMTSLTDESTVHLLVAHPDGAAGLRPLGDQLLRCLAIGAVPAAYTSVWAILLGSTNGKDPVLADLRDRWLLTYRLILVPLSAALLYPFAIRPTYATHRVMKRQARDIEVHADQLANRVDSVARGSLQKPDGDQVEKDWKELDAMRKLYSSVAPIPDWPFNRIGAARYLAALAPPVLSMTGVAEGVVKVVAKALGV